MPILTKVGHRDPKVVFAITSIFVVLSLGAVTMLYPFILMIGSSITDDVDYKEQRVIPRYFSDDNVLYRKFLHTKYFGADREPMRDLNELYRSDYVDFSDTPLALPSDKTIPTGLRTRIDEWYVFLESLTDPYFQLHQIGAMWDGVRGELQGRYVDHLDEIYNGDVTALNEAYNVALRSFGDARVPFERFALRTWRPVESQQFRDWRPFKLAQPARLRFLTTGEMRWRKFLEAAHGEVETLNAAYGTCFKGFQEIAIPERLPNDSAHSRRAADWTAFVREKWPLRFLEVDGKPAARVFKDLEEIKTVDPARLRLAAGVTRYREFVLKKHGDLAGVNQGYGTRFPSTGEIWPPVREADVEEFRERKTGIFWRFIFANYRTVLDVFLLHGRAVLNTFILCLGAVLTHLTVNPLCAYALSRFKLSYSYQVLLFCLATMAFPTEVVMIPNFLLMRDFNLLNTYWALILPSAASGYSIFLLKGFFDSLPKELYEAAMIDGASEINMFWNVTFSMCKPIFAVLALGSFLAAYGGFIWALIICSDPSMWTIMVFLYQFQMGASPSLVMASLVVVSIPTLLIFLFCQNIIMRGIIIPTFK